MSLPRDGAYWREHDIIEKYGANKFYSELLSYEDLIGENWGDKAKREGLSLLEVHKIAVEALKAAGL